MASAAKPAGILAAIVIDRTSRTPFYQQLCESLRKQIQQSSLSPACKLPAVEEIANSLNIPKTTVKRALALLETEGLIVGSPAKGYQVRKPSQMAQDGRHGTAATDVPTSATTAPIPETTTAVVLPAKAVVPAMVSRGVEPASAEFQPRGFHRLSTLEQIDFARLHNPGLSRPFRPGLPATEEFPLEIWEGLRARILREQLREMLEFSGTFGYMPLRQAIARRLRDARGVKCAPEQVIVCAGDRQALNLVIGTLVSPGDVVGLEEPGAYAVKAAFLQAGAKIRPLLVDEEGLLAPDPNRPGSPLLIHTTPQNQFPLGAALTLPRRLALLEFARKTNTWIIEDDSDGDFAYTGRPLPSLQGADEQNRVLYLGSTGRTLFPSLEIGYVVVPLSLMESFSKTKEIVGGQPSAIDQAVLAAFIAEGHFERHVQRMNILYHQRLQALAESVGTELHGFIDLEPASGGLHAVGWLARGLEESVVADRAARAGIDLPVISGYGRTALVRPGVVFGFAAYGEQLIRSTVQRLGRALRDPQNILAPYAALPPATEQAEPKAGFFNRIFPKRLKQRN